MNQEQLKEKIKDFKQRFTIGGWLNENINMVFVETWLISNFLTKETPKKASVKIEASKEALKTEIMKNEVESSKEVKEIKVEEVAETTPPVE